MNEVVVGSRGDSLGKPTVHRNLPNVEPVVEKDRLVAFGPATGAVVGKQIRGRVVLQIGEGGVDSLRQIPQFSGFSVVDDEVLPSKWRR